MYSSNRLPHSNENKQTTATHNYNVEQKRLDAKEHILNSSISVKFLKNPLTYEARTLPFQEEGLEGQGQEHTSKDLVMSYSLVWL